MSENLDNNVEQVETITEPAVETAPTEASQVQPEAKASPDFGKVIAGVKKEFRQKGYNEGLEAAKAAQAPVETAVEIPQATNSIDKNELMNELWIYNANRTDSQGQRSYKDYTDKIAEAVERAAYDPTFKLLMQKAYETGDADIVYKMTTDAKVRQEMLDTNPSKWQSKFYNLNDESSSNSKRPEPPIESLRGTPATGTKNLTYEQKRALSRQKYG